VARPPATSPRFRAGYAALLGRPNAGKSTLLNRLLGQKLAIITPKPQTTRHRLLGIKNLPEAQIVFLDTPGVHEATKPLNRAMVRAAYAAIAEADVIVLLVEAGRAAGREEQLLVEAVGKAEAPVVVAINKIDLARKETLLPQIAEWSKRLAGAPVVPLSALTGDGLDRLVAEIVERLPEGKPFFPPDQITDQPERFFAAEIVREKIFQLTGEEVPYATAVTIDAFEEPASRSAAEGPEVSRAVGARADFDASSGTKRAEEAQGREGPGRGLVRIGATIHVEKESQKAIVIGKGGAKLKEIGTQARVALEAFLGARVHLELWVKVDRNWTRSERDVRHLGYEPS
jgi:GTP-binding protein Era